MGTEPIPSTNLAVDDIRLGDFETWTRPDREGLFAKLRAERPVSFHEEPVPPLDLGFDFPQGPGFWAVSRYADVVSVAAIPTRSIPRRRRRSATCPPRYAEWLGSMINMDAPKHTKLRLIVNRGFTPRQVAKKSRSRSGGSHAESSTESHRWASATSSSNRRDAPAADHLRHDRHPAKPTTSSSSSTPT